MADMVAQGSDTNSAQVVATRLEEEARAWGYPMPVEAEADEEIPVLDLLPLLSGGYAPALDALGQQLRHAILNIGFFYVKNHGVAPDAIERAFACMRDFSALPTDVKMRYDMAKRSIGAGYLPFDSRKLPKRDKGNLVEAWIAKREHGPRNVTLDSNPWPDADLPSFKPAVLQYAQEMESLAMRMVPLYERALDLPPAYFAVAFADPLFRLRLSHYPPSEEGALAQGRFGIAPHVDTSFFTLLAQEDGVGGLAVASVRHGISEERWIKAPAYPGMLLVNTGELLKQWSNDAVRSTRHFVLPTPPRGATATGGRLSVAFFFNATANYKMECLPSCTNDANPPKYPPTSYLESQGVVQGE